MAELIFKVQKALNLDANTDPVELLVYDEHKTHYFFWYITEEQLVKLFGTKIKIYVQGKIDGKRFQYIKTETDQEW